MFYERLSELCKKSGTSVAEVAKNVLKVSNGTPTGWKNGTSPKISVLIAAASYFHVSTDYLLGVSDFPYVAGENSLSTEEQEIIDALRNAEPRDKIAAILSMKAILSISESIMGETQNDCQTTFSHSDAEKSKASGSF